MTSHPIDDITIVPDKTKELLNEKQYVDYQNYQEKLIRWLLSVGKNVDKAEGYSKHTIKTAVYQIDKFHRFVWSELTDGYTRQFTTDHADRFMNHLATTEWKQSYKSSLQKSVKREFKYRSIALKKDPWDPTFNFHDQSGTHQPRDYLTGEERGAVREAAMDFRSIPSYNNLTPEERDEWKAHLAQRFEKPKKDVSKKDWERANSWKIASLVWTSLDTGLRPIEVERAVVRWVDIENQVLRIPKEESSKNRDNWVVAIQDRTAQALEKWLKEREQYDRYEGSDNIWLTRKGNPYNSNSLAYLIRQICDEAGIDYEDRSMTWYTIRHSLGTEMSREESLGATQAQMRHKDERTTMRYDQAPVDDRRDALNRMN